MKHLLFFLSITVFTCSSFASSLLSKHTDLNQLDTPKPAQHIFEELAKSFRSECNGDLDIIALKTTTVDSKGTTRYIIEGFCFAD